MGSNLNAFMENVFFRIAWSTSILYLLFNSKKDPIKPIVDNFRVSSWQRALSIAYVIVFILLFIFFINKLEFIRYFMLAGSVIVNTSIVYNTFRIPTERNLLGNEFYAIQISFYASFFLTGFAGSLLNILDLTSEPHQIAYITFKLIQYYFPILFSIMNIMIASQRIFSKISTNSKEYSFEPYVLLKEYTFTFVSKIKVRAFRIIIIPISFVIDFVINIPIFVRSLINYFVIKPVYLFYKAVLCSWASKLASVTDTSIIRSSSKISLIIVLLLVYVLIEQNVYFSNAIKNIYGFVSSAIILPIIITDVLTYRENLKHFGE